MPLDGISDTVNDLCKGQRVNKKNPNNFSHYSPATVTSLEEQVNGELSPCDPSFLKA